MTLRAQINLGLMDAQGKTLPKDEGKAFEWLHKAAVQGNDLAEGVVASMYETAWPEPHPPLLSS